MQSFGLEYPWEAEFHELEMLFSSSRSRAADAIIRARHWAQALHMLGECSALEPRPLDSILKAVF
jgi:hypothetical protein